jgi:hypothetical protein
MRENPDGFPCAQAAMRMGLTDCIASAASPQSLLPFRYTDRIVLRVCRRYDESQLMGTKSWPGGTPANPATLVLKVQVDYQRK